MADKEEGGPDQPSDDPTETGPEQQDKGEKSKNQSDTRSDDKESQDKTVDMDKAKEDHMKVIEFLAYKVRPTYNFI